MFKLQISRAQISLELSTKSTHTNHVSWLMIDVNKQIKKVLIKHKKHSKIDEMSFVGLISLFTTILKRPNLA